MWSTEGGVPGLTVSSSGVISGIPSTVGTFMFTAIVTDSAMASTNAGLTMTVAPCIPTILNPSPLPSGDIGVRYSVSLTGSGCSGGYQFSVQPDPFVVSALPEGLTLTGVNTISGVPAQTGTFNFTITVTDSTKDSGSYSYSMTINPLPTIANPSVLPSGSVGAPYSVVISATGGTPPYVFSMNANPSWLSLSPAGVLSGTPPNAGTVKFNMGVLDSVGGQSTLLPFQATFGNSVLLVNPPSLSFSAPAGGSAPLSQSLTVVPSNKAALPAAYQVMVNTGQQIATAVVPSWLSVAPSAGDAPASLLVSVDQGTMPAGVYNGQISVLDPTGIPSNIPVTLTVSAAAPELSVLPGFLRFAARLGAPGMLTQDLWISNNGAGSLGFSASVTGGSSWITLQPASGQTTPNAPTPVQVIVNTQGLGIGAYRDVVHVTSAGGNADIPVVLFVQGNGPILGVDTTGVLFRTLHGDSSTSSRSVEVLNLGDPAAPLNFTSSLATNASWLNLGSANAGAPMSAPAALPLTLTPNAAQLAPGTYYSLLQFTDPNALNSPQYVTVVLDVEGAGAPSLPDLSPAGLYFVAAAGGSKPAGQRVTVNTSSSSPVAFQVASSTPDNTAWLSVDTMSGNASGARAGTFTVNVNPTGLTPGIYTGSVNVSMSGTLASVNVTFVVLPGTATTAGVRSHVTSPGCTPAKLAITETGMVNNFTVPAGWPATLITQLNDDCGAAVVNGSVVANFSNGDAPLTLRGDSLGNYSATWQPGSVTAQMSITLNATSGSLQPATALLTGGVAQNATPPPVLANNGIVNAFNRVAGGALSPGTIVESYGSGLASGSGSTGAPPIPLTFNGTQMLVGGLAAPLFYLSTGQLDVQVPAELAPNQQYMAVVSANGALTLPVQIDTVPLEPGVAAYADGHVIAQHADYTLINATSPAKPGEVIIIYLLGMGPTNPPVASGAAAPSSEPLARVTAQPTVTVDGQKAGVAFAGLTPGYSGLYQIDFTVPSGATSGDLDLIVSQSGIASNTTKLPVAK